MGKTLAVLAALVTVATASTAAAQPGQTYPQPQPQPPPPPPPPPAYGQPAQVTPEEYKLLLRGEYSEGQHIGGGLLGTFVGFGTGHIAQSRWGEKGWIFTLGEGASYALFIAGLIECIGDDFDNDGRDYCNETWLVGGMLAFIGFRIWEIADVWGHPATHNRRVRALRARVYGPNYYYQTPPPPPPIYLRAVDGGYTGGITLRF